MRHLIDGREWFMLLILSSLGAWAAVQFGYFLSLNSIRDGLIYLVIAPVLEEYVFRQHLQQWLAQRCSAPWFAMLVSSCVFVMLHVPWAGWMALGLFPPALTLGWYWLRFGKFWLNACLHGFFNLTLVLATAIDSV